MAVFDKLIKDLKDQLEDVISSANYYRQHAQRCENKIIQLKESIAELENLKDRK